MLSFGMVHIKYPLLLIGKSGILWNGTYKISLAADWKECYPLGWYIYNIPCCWLEWVLSFGMVHIKYPLLLIGKSAILWNGPYTISLAAGWKECYPLEWSIYNIPCCWLERVLSFGMVHIKYPLLLIGKSAILWNGTYKISLTADWKECYPLEWSI